MRNLSTGKVEKYDLADMADDLEKRGIYAQNTAAAE